MLIRVFCNNINDGCICKLNLLAESNIYKSNSPNLIFSSGCSNIGSQADLMVLSRSAALVLGSTHPESINMLEISIKSLPITDNSILPIWICSSSSRDPTIA